MAIIIETCPKCGHDLMDEVICTYPPIPRKRCPGCGWSWEGEQEEVVRVPFGGNSLEDDKVWSHGNTDYEWLNSTDCTVNNLAGNIFKTNMMTQCNVIKLSHDDIMAAVERIEKYIKE